MCYRVLVISSQNNYNYNTNCRQNDFFLRNIPSTLLSEHAWLSRTDLLRWRTYLGKYWSAGHKRENCLQQHKWTGNMAGRCSLCWMWHLALDWSKVDQLNLTSESAKYLLESTNMLVPPFMRCWALWHNVAFFQCNIAITNIYISHVCNITLYYIV